MSDHAEIMDVEATADLRVGRWQLLRRARHLLATNSLLRHNVLLLGGTAVTGVVSYLFHPVVGHLLGSARYGVVLSVSALFGIMLTPTSIAATVFNKFTADLSAQGHEDQVHHLLRHGTQLALIVGVLLTALFMALSPLLAGFLKLSSPQPIMLMSVGVVLSLASPITNGAIQGRQEFGFLALLSFVGMVLRVALAAGLILLGWGIAGAIWAYTLSGVLNYLLSWWPLRPILRGPKAPIPSLRPLFSYSGLVALAAVGGGLLFNTDTVLAKHYLPDTEAGYYAALVTIGRIVLYVSASCAGVMFPKVTALRQQGRDPRAVLAWTMAASLALSASVVLVFALFPGQLVGLLFHAPTQVTGQLVWYGVAMLLYALANVLMTYFLSLGQTVYVFILLACCALQAGLIVLWHASVAHIVMAMVMVMAVLLGGMGALYLSTHGIGRAAAPGGAR